MLIIDSAVTDSLEHLVVEGPSISDIKKMKPKNERERQLVASGATMVASKVLMGVREEEDDKPSVLEISLEFIRVRLQNGPPMQVGEMAEIAREVAKFVATCQELEGPTAGTQQPPPPQPDEV